MSKRLKLSKRLKSVIPAKAGKTGKSITPRVALIFKN